MKKTLIAFAAAAALTTSAFAEITFGAWLRALAAPVASDGKDTVASMGNSWGWGARTARLDVHARSEDGNIGFEMGVFNDVGGIAMGDDAFIWGKPVDAVKISMGKYDNNTLRGDCCYGSWNWLRPTDTWIAEDEGLLMSGNGGTGLLAEITPVDGLYIQALIPVDTNAKKVEDVYKNIQAGFAYDIDSVGKIKAQFIGKNKAKTEKVTGAWVDEKGEEAVFSKKAALAGDITYDPTKEVGKDEDGSFNKTIEAEFDLTAVENLWLGLGFQYNMFGEKKVGYKQNAMKIALGAKYQATDMIGLSASAAFFTFNKDDDKKVDPRFQAGVGVDAAVADGVSVSADVRYLSAYKYDGKKADNSDSLAFSVGATKNISSNGYMGVAFQAQTNSGTFANNVICGKTNDDCEPKKLTWCVPVALSCWF